MDRRASSDLLFLPDEKFDFDVSLSPVSSKGDEDEDDVFVGPTSPKEKCVSGNMSEVDCGVVSWSPLTGDQLEAVCLEAHRLANQLQNGEPSHLFSEDEEATNLITNAMTLGKEVFVQEVEAKLDMLSRAPSVLSPIKRQTFCVQDSPWRKLHPTVQHHLLRGSKFSATSSSHPTPRLSTLSPKAGAKAQPRTALCGKSALSVVLPNKSAVLPTSVSKSRIEKTRLQPPSKLLGGGKQSPSSRLSIRTKPSEDLLSDSTSMAPDISNSPLNSSQLGKHSLVPPKSIVRNLSGVKAVPPQSRKVTDRKNTSSSLSSVSSFNSSLSQSPAKGKLNSSLNQSLSGPAFSSINSQPVSHVRPCQATISAAAEPASLAASRRSLSTQARKPSEAECVKTIRSTPQSRIEATPTQQTPAKRILERTTSVPSVASVCRQSGLKAVSKMVRPKTLLSVSSVDSVPLKLCTIPLTPSAGGCQSLQMKAPRPSALPTPVRRRMSAIPMLTNQPQTARYLACSNTAHGSVGKETICSPIPLDIHQVERVDTLDIQSFYLEESPVTPLHSPPHSALQPNKMGPGGLGQPEPRNLIELDATEMGSSKAQEVLLLDLPVPALQPQENLLIDLTNTPDLIRTNSKTCTTAQQLIDLSSPLIKWSPEDKRENSAPLINLSF